jgi:Copper type II ascorbate-dependent monooxygenase, C-terminal domain
MTSLYCSRAGLIGALFTGLLVAAACAEQADPGKPGRSANAAGASGSSGLPCDVKKVVDAKCAATCHADPPQGTYMALKTHAQWLATGTTDKTKKYWELAKQRVNADDTKVMPPASAPALSDDEKATLNAWLDADAPASTESCAASGSEDTPDPSDIDTSGLDCYKFLAHAEGDKNAKFKVGAAVDAYYNFGFQAPWTGMVYGVVVRPVTDNAKVLHHWLIYRENIPDGAIQRTIGQHAGGELIHGWAPGGISMDFRKHGDVGFELPPTTYAIEFHYNSSDPDALDASGVELCVQKAPPKNIASMSWLGRDHGGTLSYASGICFSPATSWTGTCKPAEQTEPIHMLFITPHLHQAGRHLKAVIKGTDGTERVLHDKPFDFNYQVTYETEEVLMPGETVTTSCTFSEPKCAGQKTTQEMCYLFTYAWPQHALVDNGPEGTFMHGEGVCLGQ